MNVSKEELLQHVNPMHLLIMRMAKGGTRSSNATAIPKLWPQLAMQRLRRPPEGMSWRTRVLMFEQLTRRIFEQPRGRIIF